MRKRLTKHGNSWALVIDKPILELLRIDPQAPLEISTDGQTLIVSPVPDAQREEKFNAALEKIKSKYGRALNKLA
jgi:antitoxin component of MazEF toxin-antitoxin module